MEIGYQKGKSSYSRTDTYADNGHFQTVSKSIYRCYIEFISNRKTQLLEKYIEFLEQIKTYPCNISSMTHANLKYVRIKLFAKKISVVWVILHCDQHLHYY